VEFFISGKLFNPLNGSHGHWAVSSQERRRWRFNTRLAYMEAVPVVERTAYTKHVMAPKRVTLQAHTWNRMDTDGLAASLKSVRDALIDCGLIHSDDIVSGHTFDYQQVIDRKRRGVTVTVELA
jgi:hypothetical protein